MNKHGLSRNIPSSVKREVRQRCGYGCVVCGSAIYDYEHFEPEFAEAKEHKAAGIALLCPTDHARKRKGLLSKSAYLAAIANPKAKEQRGAKAEWETSHFAPTIQIGDKLFIGGTSILRIDGETLIGFHEPEECYAPPRLLARFFSSEDNEVFSIIDNEVVCHSDAFDIESVGDRWIVRSALYKVSLELRLAPPKTIQVIQMSLRYKGWGLEVSGTEFLLTHNGEPSLAFSGDAIIFGPCFLNLNSDGSAVMEDMEVAFGVPSQLHAKAEELKTPQMFEWPLYFFLGETGGVAIEDIDVAVIQNVPDADGNPVSYLPVFTSEASAKQPGAERIPPHYRLQNLGSNGFIEFLRRVVIPKGIKQAIFDPDLCAVYHAIAPVDLIEFIKQNERPFLDSDPCPCGSGENYGKCHGSLP
ncbi:MAG: SEC-C domain-containing protein [Blastomonas sp.]